MKEVTLEQIEEWYKQGLNFQRKDGTFENAKINERMYAGDQWFHVSKDNTLPRITLNFIKRTTNFIVSAVAGGEVKLNYSPQAYLEDVDGRYEEAAELFNAYSEIAYEEMKQNFLNEQMIKDAWLAGIGLIHYYWDDDYVGGNGTIIKGRVVGEIIDSVNFFPQDPTNTHLQSQGYVIVTYRDTVDNVKKEAKANKVPQEKIEQIQPDSDTNDQSFDKAKDEVTGSKNVTVKLCYYRGDNGNIWMCKAVKGCKFKDDKDTQKKLYPIIYMNGEERKRSIYGTSPVTEIRPNQVYVNTLYSMAMVSAQRTAYPKAVYDKTRISGMSNAVGTAIGVNGEVSGAFTYSQTGQISTDVYNLVDSVVSATKENQGANDALLGNVKPENTSALLVNQQQSNVPLETIQRRYYNSQEDLGRILEEFWKVHYVVSRPITIEDENGQEQIVQFNGSDYADIKMNTKIDVGASSKWSEIISINTLNEWLGAQHITFVEALQRFPKNIVRDIQGLIDTRIQEQEQMQAIQEEFMQGMTPEQLQQFEQLPPEQQEQLIMEYSEQ